MNLFMLVTGREHAAAGHKALLDLLVQMLKREAAA